MVSISFPTRNLLVVTYSGKLSGHRGRDHLNLSRVFLPETLTVHFRSMMQDFKHKSVIFASTVPYLSQNQLKRWFSQSCLIKAVQISWISYAHPL